MPAAAGAADAGAADQGVKPSLPATRRLMPHEELGGFGRCRGYGVAVRSEQSGLPP